MTARFHQEYDGVKTYFFAPLLRYILENELKMVENQQVNQFASFVMGLSNDFPTATDIYSILVGSNPTNSRIVAAIDSMILFGADYSDTVKQLAEKLEVDGVNHDVFSLRLQFNDKTTFEKELAAHAENSMIRKFQGSGLLNFFRDMLVAKSESERLYAFIALCAADLDWDAYVFLKLFSHGTPKLSDEIEAICKNITKQLVGVRGSLTPLWLTGGRSDPRSKFLGDLKTVDVIKLIVPVIAYNFLNIISKDDDKSLSEKSALTSQVLFLVFHAVLKGEWYHADEIYSELHPCIKEKMFPAFNQATMKASVSLLSFFLQRFVTSRVSGSPYDVGDLRADGTLYYLADPSKRGILTKLFIDYSAAISRDIFGFPVPIEYNREDLLRTCQYIIDVLKNYDIEKSFGENKANNQ